MIVKRILALHGTAVLVAVFALPALEASVFIGFVFPGEIAVVLGGVLAFQGRVRLGAVIAVAILGAIVGDTVGYFVGKRWGRRMLDGTIGRFVRAEHLERGEAFLLRQGGRGVLLGRFTAAFRALVPGLAGMSGMNYRTFATYNAIGGAIWAGGFVLAGYAAGNSWRRIEHFTRAASLIVVVLVVLAIAVLALRRRKRRLD